MNHPWIVYALFGSLIGGLAAAIKSRRPLPWAAFGFLVAPAIFVLPELLRTPASRVWMGFTACVVAAPLVFVATVSRRGR